MVSLVEEINSNSLKEMNPNVNSDKYVQSKQNDPKFLELLDLFYEGKFRQLKQLLPTLDLNGYVVHENGREEVMYGYIFNMFTQPGLEFEDSEDLKFLLEAIMERNPNLELPAFKDNPNVTFRDSLFEQMKQVIVEKDTERLSRMREVMNQVNQG